jgi:hypothetical protein
VPGSGFEPDQYENDVIGQLVLFSSYVIYFVVRILSQIKTAVAFAEGRLS